MPTPITVPLTTGSDVIDVFIAEERYAIVTTDGGVDVVDLNTGKAISSGTLPSTPTTVAVDWRSVSGKLYVGTTSSGVFTMNYVKVRELDSDFTGELVQSFTTVTSPPVSDNEIKDLDVLPGRLLVGTAAGIDFISNSTEFSTRTLVSGSRHVALTTSGGYWTTASGVSEGALEVNYNLLSTTGTSIIDVDFEYTSLSNPSLPAEPPLDLSVSESSGNLTAVAIATGGGSFVFEELQGNEAAANNKLLSAEAIVSLDFHPGSFFTSGCLYTTTRDQLPDDKGGLVKVYDLSSNSVAGTHDSEEGTRGITVVTGTHNIIRAVDVGVCPVPIGN
jgi:hypothetical protein